MYRRLLIICFLFPLAAATADVPGAYDYGDPTAEEQLVLERINAIRAAPDDFAARYGYAAGTYSDRQPLVMDARLLQAARAQSLDMATRLYFSHTPPDNPPRLANGRVLDAGFPLSIDHKELVAPDLATGNTVENIGARTPPDAEANLDFLMTSEEHRKNILSRDRPFVDQAGIGLHSLPKWVQIGDNKLQMFHTQEFAKDDDSTPHLLGVVYEDRNGNGRYDAGEGIGGVTVATTTGGYTTTTATAGGFGIRMETTGTFTLRASGGVLPEPMEKMFTVGAANVKVDFAADLPESFELVKSSFKVDFKKRAKGKTEVDSLKVKLLVDPERLPADLHGVSATVTFGDLTFGPFTLSGSEKKGTFKSLLGVLPKVKLTVKRKTGKVLLSVKKADLMDDLGIANETTTGTRIYDVTLTIGPAFEAPGAITHVLTSTADKKAKALALP